MRKPSEFENHPVSHVEAVASGKLRAICKHVVDGDTYDFFVSLGLDEYTYITVRLHDFDTPELFHPRNDAELTHAREARDFAIALMLGEPCLLATYRDQESFGRYVADISVIGKGGYFLDVKKELDRAGLKKRTTY